MGKTHHDQISVVNGYYVGAKGAEKAITALFEPGNQFFVNSADGDNTASGLNWGAALASIDTAVGKCTANNGDIIWVAPGHAETINAAAAINLDVAGITIIGLGNGEDRPTITIGSSEDASTVVIGAADVRIHNIIFQPGNDGVDILLDINADGALVEKCEFRSDEANAYQADTYIDINGGGANAADRCTIRNCKISSITAGAAQAINIGAVEDALVIEDCWIDGAFTAAGILSGSIFTNALIRNNIISNRAAGIHAVEFTAACTGLFVDNRMYGDTLGTILDPGSLKCLGNLETDAIDQAGVDSPRTSAGGFPADSITAAAIAAAAIDAATFAADALQAMQDEAEDALEGENLDHLAAVTTAAADMTAEVVDGSVISRIISKASDTSSYDPTTDSLEMLSDKLGAFSGDGGAAQDDSVKASLDLAQTELAKVGTVTNSGGTATIGAVLGDVANVALATRMNQQRRVSSVALATADLTGTVTRFTVAGGPVKITHMGVLVTTAIAAGANTLQFSFTPTDGGATDLSGATDTASAGAQQLFVLDGAKATGPVKVTDVGIMLRANESAMPIILGTGVIQTIFSAGPPASGAATLYVEWEPLVSGATVS